MDISLKNLNVTTWFGVTFGLFGVAFFLLVVNIPGWVKLVRNSVQGTRTEARYI
ncbi:hypothetical protein F5B22DRAFT_596145 [Xylaria bambusicola]|uniref:uncharacterized protein n=1 Tax=Xylaria bambusicola TaxID=326684 RepID=UPI00200836DD|nr:uncharacterized protein F5B22DRAFT_596145 [Xylaria bambusicola]KAI0521194.1 hypothetical protein F5B22DRAFT_596145 [Xylaria bambusicola]